MSGEPYEVVFATMVILAIGTFAYHHLSRLRVPYTVIMFLIGLGLGLLSNLLPPIKNYYVLLAHIPPRLLFHIFLPILIFEGSYGMKTDAFRQVFEQAIILAGPGLVLNTAILALVLKVILPAWNWYLIVLVGSLLSATDPVAVVALLKDLGVDRRITALIDGEAILNDGTAIIGYTLFLPAASAGFFTESMSAMVLQSLVLLFGGVVLGLCAGWIQVACLQRTNDDLVRTCITVCGPFISYYVADVWVQTSGVITLCFEGVYLAANYPEMFPGQPGSMFNNVWHFVVHLANTMLFALVGIIMAVDVLPVLTAVDFLQIGYLYVFVVLGRLAMLYCMKPAMDVFSYKPTHRHLFLLTHGGLRGGVATALALAVFTDPTIPHAQGIKVLVLTSGVVLLTITVNATTSDWMVSKLGMRVKDANRKRQMQAGLNRVRLEGKRALRRLKSSAIVRNACWSEVDRMLDLVSDPYNAMETKGETSAEQLHKLVMRHFKTSVWRQRDSRQLTSAAVRALTQAISVAIRDAELITTVHLVPVMRYPWYVDVARVLGFATVEGRFRQWQDHTNFGILMGYARAIDDVEAGMILYLESVQQLQEVQEWLTTERHEIERKIAEYASDKPLEARSFVTMIAAGQMFNACFDAAQELHVRNGFSLTALSALEGAIGQAAEKVSRLPRALEDIPSETIWGQGVFREIPPAVVAEISRRSHLVQLREGEVLPIHRLGPEVVVVASGALSVLARQGVTFGFGQVLGLPKCFTQRKTTSVYTAITPTRVLSIPKSDFLNIAEQCAPLLNLAVHVAGVDTAERLLARRPNYERLSYDDLRERCNEGRVICIPTSRFRYPRAAGEVIVFLKGESAFGAVTTETEPFIVPEAMSLEWAVGTLLFAVTPGLDIDDHPTRAVAALENASIDTREFVQCEPEMSLRELRLVVSKSGFHTANAGVVYEEQNWVTGSPFLNQMQASFLLEMEMLGGTRRQYQQFPDAATRTVLVAGIATVLSFLSRFCLQYFTAENALYAKLEDDKTFRERRSRQDAFSLDVANWMELQLRDALCDEVMLQGMVDFAHSHFPLTHNEDLHGSPLVAPGAGGSPSRQ